MMSSLDDLIGDADDEMVNGYSNNVKANGSSQIRSRPVFTYRTHKTFSSLEEARSYVRDNHRPEYLYQKAQDSKLGRKTYYVCRSDRRCPARLVLNTLSRTGKTMLQFTTNDHWPHGNDGKQSSLDAQTKAIIEKVIKEDGLTNTQDLMNRIQAKLKPNKVDTQKIMSYLKTRKPKLELDETNLTNLEDEDDANLEEVAPVVVADQNISSNQNNQQWNNVVPPTSQNDWPAGSPTFSMPLSQHMSYDASETIYAPETSQSKSSNKSNPVMQLYETMAVCLQQLVPDLKTQMQIGNKQLNDLLQYIDKAAK